MKNVLLSHDFPISVYSVPDEVADHLEEYCNEFAFRWLWTSPHAAKYHVKIGDTVGVCFDDKDFIDYLNQYVCQEPSVLLETFSGVYMPDEVPEKYRGLPWYNF